MSKGILLSEEERIKKVLAASYTQRFDLLMRLISIGKMLKGAKITHIKKSGRPKDLIDVIELEKIQKSK